MAQPGIFQAKHAATDLIAQGVDGNLTWAHIKVQSGEGLADLLNQCAGAGAAVIVGAPRQLPTSLGATTVVFADLSKLDQVIEHRQSDQVISIQCGMTMAQLDLLLEKSGQWWPVCAAPADTICDIIARGDGGWLEHGFGGPRHLVLGLQAALPNGKLIKTGGKVVKNVTGYDVTKLIVGARSTIAVPVLAHLRLFARPQKCACLIVKARRLDEVLRHASALLSSGLPVAVLEIMQVSSSADEDGGPLSWLKEFASAGEEDSFLSIVQVFEQEEVIAEVLPQLQSLAAQNVVQHVFRPSVSSQLSNTSTENNGIEISCPLSRVKEIVELAHDCGCARRFWLRPSSGRLRFALPAPDHLQALRIALTRFCRQTRQTLSMAVIDGESFQVTHLPEPDPAACDIIAGIKRQFDPSGCLNPCASFQ